MRKVAELSYPVLTPEGQQLLPAGTRLTPSVMAELVQRARRQPLVRQPLLDHGTVAADLARFCDQPPYDRIFADPTRRRELFADMRQAGFPPGLLALLDRFRRDDPYTYRHMLLVFALSLFLAQELGHDRRDMAREAAAAPTHDFGKLCVPATVLQKKTSLTDAEQRQLAHHAAAGYVLLAYHLQDADHPAAVTARDHHERRDGSGYPRGIRLADPLVETVAVADVFDALISGRPYRRQCYNLRTALEELTAQAQRGAFAWAPVLALISACRRQEGPSGRCSVSHERRGTPPADNRYRGADGRSKGAPEESP